MNLSEALKAMESEVGMSEFIPFSHHVTPYIVATSSADYLTTWKLTGRSHECADIRDVFQWVRDLNNFIRGVGTADISFWTHIHRRRVVEYPDSAFDNFFCKTLDDKYRASFSDYNLMVNDLYLTVVYRQASDDIMAFFARREKLSAAQKTDRQNEAIKTLNDINRTIDGHLARHYGGELLGIYEHDGHAFSSTLEWLGFLVNGEHARVPVARGRIGDYLGLNRPIFSRWGEIGEQRRTDKTVSFGMLEVRDFDSNTEPGQLNALLESNYEFVLTQSFSCLSLHAARGFLQRHKQSLLDAEDVGTTQIAEIDDALDRLVARDFVMGEHHGTLLVFGGTAAEVRNHLSKAKGAILDCGVVPSQVDLALEAGYWAQLPANWKWRPRPMPITSLNFLSFAPLHNFLSGKPVGNPWGPAVTILKTQSGTPLYLNFHVSGLDEDANDKRLLGHTFIGGQSSSGKTTLLGFLLAQAQKFNPTAVVFDLDRGMQIAVEAMGGKYLPLRNGVASGFNPFQLEPTRANMLFLKGLVLQLVKSDGSPVTHRDDVEIEGALTTLMTHIDKPLRRLSMLVQNLPNPLAAGEGAPSVHARLAKWCDPEQLGWLFDNEVDELDLTTHRMYGFDVTDFLDNPVTRTPTIMYLLFRTEAMIDGRRFMYVFEEFWRILDDPQFESFVKQKLKTIRKANGICVFSTQEPGDALESAIAKTIVQQIATYILLQNPRADRADYTEGLKLTLPEFEALKAIPEGSRRFLVKQGEQAALAGLNLTGFDDELLILSGTPDNADIAEQVIAEKGRDPAVWIPAFLKRVRASMARQKLKDPAILLPAGELP
ncbi:Type IV secretion system protein virB4 [Paraburkholderia ultramafica]|uniref:Type IV secretion system protein virB4 n=1 Tax=Paraburkholderia ultramafica TaxID=1544867 RepID=A0A6S7BJK4_9BURK|nr:VirB4 family type IV secretion/conjugal transfer ATPase [Paraburkholderia ultramafica]CAB3802644.1 Type IV secretion system protein virB4 [Paraburkholderia ultramafica]